MFLGKVGCVAKNKKSVYLLLLWTLCFLIELSLSAFCLATCRTSSGFHTCSIQDQVSGISSLGLRFQVCSELLCLHMNMR